MNMLVWLLLGFLLGLLYVSIARKRERDEKSLLASGIVVGAWIYVPLTFTGNADTRWLIVEVIGAAIFTAMAWAGIRYSIGWLTLGWGIHIFWDFGLHLIGEGRTFTDTWYPLLCIAFDLIVVAYISFFMKRRSLAVIR